MNVTYARERFIYCFAEMIPLLKANYLETGFFRDIPMVVNAETYSKLDEIGGLTLFTARDPGGKLVGYAVFFVQYHLHNITSLQANQDVIYITPKQRGFGMAFVKWCDECLRQMGVEVVYQHVNLRHDWGRILERIGYQKIEHTYARRLKARE